MATMCAASTARNVVRDGERRLEGGLEQRQRRLGVAARPAQPASFEVDAGANERVRAG